VGNEPLANAPGKFREVKQYVTLFFVFIHFRLNFLLDSPHLPRVHGPAASAGVRLDPYVSGRPFARVE